MPDPSPLTVTRTQNTLRVSWDNRQVSKSLSLLVVFLIATVAFAAVTVVVAFAYLPCSLPFGGVALLLVYSLLGRTWGEAIELSAEGIAYLRTGLLAPGPRRYPLADIREFSQGIYPGSNDEYGEGNPTLNLIHTRWSLMGKRTIAGYWLVNADQRRVFDEMQAFAREAKLPLKFVSLDHSTGPGA